MLISFKSLLNLHLFIAINIRTIIIISFLHLSHMLQTSSDLPFIYRIFDRLDESGYRLEHCLA